MFRAHPMWSCPARDCQQNSFSATYSGPQCPRVVRNLSGPIVLPCWPIRRRMRVQAVEEDTTIHWRRNRPLAAHTPRGISSVRLGLYEGRLIIGSPMVPSANAVFVAPPTALTTSPTSTRGPRRHPPDLDGLIARRPRPQRPTRRQ